MKKMKEFLQQHEIQSDELGRAIIHDVDLLDQINGAVFSSPEFVMMDAACGNGNCVC